jgi:hypothetical protein
MYGPQVLGKSSVGVGAAVLPATGNNRPLFYAAATLFVGGLVTLAVSTLAARKARKTVA